MIKEINRTLLSSQHHDHLTGTICDTKWLSRLGEVSSAHFPVTCVTPRPSTTTPASHSTEPHVQLNSCPSHPPGHVPLLLFAVRGSSEVEQYCQRRSQASVGAQIDILQRAAERNPALEGTEVNLSRIKLLSRALQFNLAWWTSKIW